MDRLDITTYSDTDPRFLDMHNPFLMVEGTAASTPYLGLRRMRGTLLIKCEYCGVMIIPTAVKCEHCGAPTRQS